MYNLFPSKNLSVIPNSYEKYMSLGMGNLKFIDGFQFMASSLEKLVTNLYDENDKYKNFHSMKQYFGDHTDALCRKGMYPYEWMDDISKMNHVGLPPKDAFYSKLSQTTFDHMGEYIFAEHVYKSLKCKSFRDYHLAYLKTDVLLLADVFENFRNTCFEHYGLDPANYISAASLSWDAMMLKTGVKLELISDLKVLDIIERSRRGGLCFVGSKRHVVANNKYMDTYDADKESNYLMYLDANNLHGWAMVQSLPHDEVRLNTEVTLEEILTAEDEGEVGYVVECDLHFPTEIHDKLKHYPPAPENMVPEDEWLSEYQLSLKSKFQIKAKTKKLVPHLMDHNNYCIHYRNLKYLVGLGVQIKMR